VHSTRRNWEDNNEVLPPFNFYKSLAMRLETAKRNPLSPPLLLFFHAGHFHFPVEKRDSFISGTSVKYFTDFKIKGFCVGKSRKLYICT